MGSRMRRRPGEKDGGKDTTRAGISQSATSARRRAISEHVDCRHPSFASTRRSLRAAPSGSGRCEGRRCIERLRNSADLRGS